MLQSSSLDPAHINKSEMDKAKASLIQRLETQHHFLQQQKAPFKALAPYLSTHDFQTVIARCLRYLRKEKLDDLKPGYARRLPKVPEHDYDRTLCILHIKNRQNKKSPQPDLAVLLHTKSKLYDHTKVLLPKHLRPKGSSKSGKQVFRIDEYHKVSPWLCLSVKGEVNLNQPGTVHIYSLVHQRIACGVFQAPPKLGGRPLKAPAILKSQAHTYVLIQTCSNMYRIKQVSQLPHPIPFPQNPSLHKDPGLILWLMEHHNHYDSHPCYYAAPSTLYLYQLSHQWVPCGRFQSPPELNGQPLKVPAILKSDMQCYVAIRDASNVYHIKQVPQLPYHVPFHNAIAHSDRQYRSWLVDQGHHYPSHHQNATFLAQMKQFGCAELFQRFQHQYQIPNSLPLKQMLPDCSDALKEVHLMQTLPPDMVKDIVVTEAIFKNKKIRPNGFKLSLYTPFSGQTLNDFQNHALTNGRVQSLTKFYQYAYDLLRLVQRLHERNRIHQDLKHPNIISTKTASNTYQFSLIDFGATFKKIPYATGYFESPEISLLYSTRAYKQYPHHPQYPYFKNNPQVLSIIDHFDNLQDTYGGSLAQQHAKTILAQMDQYLSPDPANDVWAMGIVLYSLRYQDFPTGDEHTKQHLKKDPLLSGCLAPLRKDRWTAKQACEWLAKELKKVSAVPLTFQRDHTKQQLKNTNLTQKVRSRPSWQLSH